MCLNAAVSPTCLNYDKDREDMFAESGSRILK